MNKKMVQVITVVVLVYCYTIRANKLYCCKLIPCDYTSMHMFHNQCFDNNNLIINDFARYSNSIQIPPAGLEQNVPYVPYLYPETQSAALNLSRDCALTLSLP